MKTKTGPQASLSLKSVLLAGFFLADLSFVSAAPVQLSTQASYWAGVEYEGGETAINRLSISSNLKKRWGRRLHLDVEASFDWAKDEAGLGSTSAFAPLSSPVVKTNRLRAQIERATLRYRNKSFSATLGKQVLAWGVLDGLRIADRADPVRLRDFVLAEQRPERLGRWGLRVRTNLGESSLDVAAFFDNTADQAPSLGGAFFPTASRSLGGYDLGALAVAGVPTVDARGHGLAQTTWAMKLARRMGAYDVQMIGLHGPDTQPVFAQGSPTEIQLRYPTRSMAALTVQRALGGTVVRFETAYIPDQSTNLEGQGQQTQVGRFLAGVGIDFRPGGRWFVNAQLGLDQLEAAEADYARPRTDLIATLRVQRNYVQDRLELKAELIGSVQDGDGYLGAAMGWQFNDKLKGAIGTDILFGARDELFGQFDNRSRAWLRLTYAP